jgi:hypothetical protein
MTTASLCGPTCGSQFFVHVFGALALFGGVFTVAIVSLAALRIPAHALLLRRIAFWTTLVLMVPAWIVMYVGGYSLLSHEGLDESTPGWAEAGIHLAEVAAALTIILLILSWLARRRPRLGTWLAVVATLYALALAVAWFFMSAKPSI